MPISLSRLESVMLNKSVKCPKLLQPLFVTFFQIFFAIVFYSSRRIVSDKKNHVTLKIICFEPLLFSFFKEKQLFPDFFPAIMFYSPRRIDSDKKNHVTLNYNVF